MKHFRLTNHTSPITCYIHTYIHKLTFLLLFTFASLSTGTFFTSALAQTPIQCGETKTGFLNIGELHSYTFTTNAGDVVNVKMARTSGSLNPVIKPRFWARSSTCALTIDCTQGWLIFSLKNKNLKVCVSNPVNACVFIEGGPCICAEGVFVEKKDKIGRPISLTLNVTEACSP